ncbi:MAG: hypothetical protein RBR34_08150 [Rhodospirillaceae bacterium]|nr:hypothetical protein [Rhodospirillaceae bacterium]
MPTTNMMPVEVTFKPSGKAWIGVCRSLDIATQGETFERAQANMAEALALFFESCLKRGTLEEVLRQAGYSKTHVRSIAREAKALFPPPHVAAGRSCHA